MGRKIALITGVTGQDGSYLAEFLLDKGYEVHGVARRTSMMCRSRIDPLRDDATSSGKVFQLHYGDLGDSSSLNRIMTRVQPTELYNLAAQSHVGISFQQPEYTTDVGATGVLRLLEAVRSNHLDTRTYQASTSELYGRVETTPQTEATPFHPCSPYGVAKLYSYWIIKNYREAYGMHASNGILFNHESPRRGENFVTRKMTLGLARIKAGLQETIKLGNLNASRDWGHAEDYVRSMWLMLQQEQPDDYVIATGEAHTVREFFERAADVAGMRIEWEGVGDDEIGRDAVTGRTVVEIDPRYRRPVDVEKLVGDASKARRKLAWTPRIGFDELVDMMMTTDLERFGQLPSKPTMVHGK